MATTLLEILNTFYDSTIIVNLLNKPVDIEELY